MTREWNAQVYHRVSQPQFEWGLKVLSRLALEGGETVLDAGCGSGRLTAKLLERLPQGRAVALDASANMLTEARKTLATFGERIRFVQADLGAFALEEKVDAIFSTATFHWVLDHDALFSCLAAALKPGGALVAQCGGEGNLVRAHVLASEVAQRERFVEHLGSYRPETYYSSAGDAQRRLERAGFEVTRATLTEAPTPFESAEAFRTFIGAVVLKNAVARLPEALRDAYLDEVTEAAQKSEQGLALDYVRLDLDARRR